MKLILKPSLVAVLILVALFSCAKKHTGGGGLRSLGDLTVNGPQFDGSVHAGTKVLYTLKEINANQNYTLRTEIGLRSDGSSTSPDGTLTVKIYTSADAFRNNPDDIVASANPAINNPNIYEVNFTALPNSSVEYVVVISGDPGSVPGIQFFYNLRLMSADRLKTFASSVISPGSPAYDAQLTTPLSPGFLNIYNGGTIDPSDIYSITLTSNATTTIANPQIFVYLDSRLTTNSLLASSISTTTDFVVTRFSDGVPDNAHAEHRNDNVITGVTFTSGAEGPFIVLKGSVISAVTYTLSVGP
jgi:hypothetical protein